MRRARTERPENFEVDLSHPLMRGAVLLGLGQSHHSFRYRDESDKGNHGLLTGYTGAGNTPVDRWGRALGRAVLGFDRIGDKVPCAQSVSASATGTYAAWTNLTLGLYQFVMGDGNIATDRNGVSLYWATANKPIFEVSNATTYKLIIANNALSAGWSHVAGVWDGAFLQLYINGRSAAAAVASTLVPTPAYALQIGYAAQNSGGYMAGGSLADECAWSRALTPAEIGILADPSNVMLSGAIREPRPRRNFIGQAGEAPPGVGVRYGGAIRWAGGGVGVRRGGALRGA